MMTVKQVAALTGVSARTLQFYDEIGLLKPTEVTEAGYRLYGEGALETLEQILFFKELDFTLKEIKAILDDPAFDKAAAYRKQRELIGMKRDRLNGLLERLDRLIGGEKCMDFKEFDMSGYFKALNDFKSTHEEQILERLGSMEAFDQMAAELRSREEEVAPMAAAQYGSLENYTRAMVKNLGGYLENGPAVSPDEVKGLVEKGDGIARRLTADISREVEDEEVQGIVREWVAFTEETNRDVDMGANYWPFMAECYLNNTAFIEGTDRKYGAGAARFIGRALKAYIEGK